MLGAFSPEAFGRSERVNLMLLPPLLLIACGMVLLMVDGAERYGELIAHLEAESSGLGKADVMSVRRRSPANETGLLRYKAQMLL